MRRSDDRILRIFEYVAIVCAFFLLFSAFHAINDHSITGLQTSCPPLSCPNNTRAVDINGSGCPNFCSGFMRTPIVPIRPPIKNCSDYKCSNWSECVNGAQTMLCSGSCGVGAPQIRNCTTTTTPTPVCGNNLCENGEDSITCPQDCRSMVCDVNPQVPVSGTTCCPGYVFCSTSNLCVVNGSSCPTCGNGICDVGETSMSCPTDCTNNPITILNATCTESWSCSDWGECAVHIIPPCASNPSSCPASQLRTCTDSNNCGTMNNRPQIGRLCNETTSTTPENAAALSIPGMLEEGASQELILGSALYTIEVNAIGGANSVKFTVNGESLPSLGVGETYNLNGGGTLNVTDILYSSSTDTPSKVFFTISPAATKSLTLKVSSACSESWTCSWSECVNDFQSMICSDQNNCGTTDNKPSESQTCTSAAATGTQAPAPSSSSGAIILIVLLLIVAAIIGLPIFFVLRGKKRKKLVSQLDEVLNKAKFALQAGDSSSAMNNYEVLKQYFESYQKKLPKKDLARLQEEAMKLYNSLSSQSQPAPATQA